MLMKRLFPGTVLLFGLAGTFAVSGEPAEGVGRGSYEPAVPKPVGLAGCASSNCHGRSGGDDSVADRWRTSCSVWAARDPHARAFDVLDPEKNAIARKMQTKFDRLKPGYHPQKDPKCLACHANPGIPAGDTPELVTLRSEGVGCEACHGNAELWLATHTLKESKDRHGLAELNDLGVRAKTCAGCHVGGTGDMNHDMIAAGHPKLNFEFASHLARMPKHWYERDRATGEKRGPEYLLTSWIVGANAAGEALCELSIRRQQRKDPWPELAEWNCYSCHHDLMNKAWRPEAGFKLGPTAWSPPWPLGGPDVLIAKVNASTGEVREKTLNELARLFHEQKGWLGNKPTGDARATMFNELESAPALPDWDTAYRMYLALGVLETVRWEKAKTEDSAIFAAMREVEKALNLPGHPKEATYDPKAVREKLKTLTEAQRAGWK
jgi:hypothetical protein